MRAIIADDQARRDGEAATLLTDFAEWKRLTGEADAADGSPESDATAERLLLDAAEIADRILSATAATYGGLMAQIAVITRELQAGGDAEQRLADTLRRSVPAVTGRE